MRVLIADRDLPLLETLQSYLWDCGHEAEIAGDGIECSTILDHFIPDVVVLDRDLLWGGYEGVVEKMSEDPLLAHIPIIQIRDPAIPGRRGGLWGGSIVGQLLRPFRISQLLAELASVQRQRSAVRSSKANGLSGHKPSSLNLS